MNKPRIYKRFTHNGAMLFVTGIPRLASEREKALWIMARDFCDRENKRKFLKV